MQRSWTRWTARLASAVLATATASAAAAAPSTIAGAWVVRADQGDAHTSSVLSLVGSDAALEGDAGPLDTLGVYPLHFQGTRGGAGVHFVVTSNGEPAGTLDLVETGPTLSGSGALFGTPVAVVASRPAVGERAPRVIDFNPSAFHVLTSDRLEPVLRLASGDTVRTRTVDNYGHDEHGRAAAMPGNPGTGPFYVDGAAPGDTLAIRILKLTPNRATARMANSLDPRAVDPGYVQVRTPGRTDLWVLDVVKGVARIEAPSERLRNFEAPLRPMLGVVAAAPAAGAAVSNSELGYWGGNLDFPDLRAGVTLYLPVHQPGGLLFFGDAHARQGDGEVTGQGLETSMAVEFQVDVIKHGVLGEPWAENAEYVMVSGIGGSLNDAFQHATTEMARWLKARYQLDDNDVAAVLGSSIEYSVTEVVDPKYHVVAKLRKETLKLISPDGKTGSAR
jgi:acetamidase/formamidase